MRLKKTWAELVGLTETQIQMFNSQISPTHYHDFLDILNIMLSLQSRKTTTS